LNDKFSSKLNPNSARVEKGIHKWDTTKTNFSSHYKSVSIQKNKNKDKLGN
jgi:hypothetical protein